MRTRNKIACVLFAALLIASGGALAGPVVRQGPAVAGSTGTLTTVKSEGVQVGGADIVTLDFGDGLTTTESPDTEINVSLSGTIDGTTFVIDADGNGYTQTAGANTFNHTCGTASLDVAAGATVNIDKSLTVDGQATTITGAGQANTITLNESLTVGDGNSGTVTFSGATKTLTVEDTSVVNQDLSSDASPTFADLTLNGTVLAVDADGNPYTLTVSAAGLTLSGALYGTTLDLTGTTICADSDGNPFTLTVSSGGITPSGVVLQLTSTFTTTELSADSGSPSAAQLSDTLITNRGWDGNDDQTFTLPTAVAGLKFKFIAVVASGATADTYFDCAGTDQFYLDGVACGDGERVWTSEVAIAESIAFHTFTLDGTNYDWAADSINGTWADKGS